MSATIKAAILALKGRIADAYTAISAKGGTLPATQDSANLPTAIASIPSGGGVKLRLNSNSANFWSNLTYENLGETSIEYVANWEWDSILRNCTAVKIFDLRGITVANVSGGWMDSFMAGSNLLEEVYLNGNFPDFQYSRPDWIGWRGLPHLRVLRVGSWAKNSINISNAGAMTRETLVDFLNDLPTPYDSSQVITLGSYYLGLLTAEDRAIATDKGWSLA